MWENRKINTEQENASSGHKQYQSRIIWPLEIIEEAAFSPCFVYLSPIVNVTANIINNRGKEIDGHTYLRKRLEWMKL